MYKVRNDVPFEKLKDFNFNYDASTNTWYDLESCRLTSINWFINLIKIDGDTREVCINKNINDKSEIEMLLDKFYTLTIYKIIEKV